MPVIMVVKAGSAMNTFDTLKQAISKSGGGGERWKGCKRRGEWGGRGRWGGHGSGVGGKGGGPCRAS